MTKKILISGGGIGGLTTALALAKRGFTVEVLEQSPCFEEVGAGIQLSPNAMYVLGNLGLKESILSKAFRPQKALMRHYKSGEVYLSLPLADDCFTQYGAEYLHIHRADLQQILVQACNENKVNIKLSSKVSGYQNTTDAVRVSLHGGEILEADVLIGSDGIHSTVLGQMHGNTDARFTGQVAWRGIIPSALLPNGLIKPNANLWVGPNQHFVSYYLRGGELINFVAVEEKSHWQKESWSELGDIERLRKAFSGWHEEVSAILAAADKSYVWALFDRKPLSTWVDGKVALLGDACHPMLPFVAQGAAMAIEDASILAQCLCLHDDTQLALEQYQSARHNRVTKIQNMASANASLYHMSTPIDRLKLQGLKYLNKFSPKLAGLPLKSLYSYKY